MAGLCFEVGSWRLQVTQNYPPSYGPSPSSFPPYPGRRKTKKTKPLRTLRGSSTRAAWRCPLASCRRCRARELMLAAQRRAQRRSSARQAVRCRTTTLPRTTRGRTAAPAQLPRLLMFDASCLSYWRELSLRRVELGVSVDRLMLVVCVSRNAVVYFECGCVLDSRGGLHGRVCGVSYRMRLPRVVNGLRPHAGKKEIARLPV